VDAAWNAEHLGMPPTAGLESRTAVFKKCTMADETLPCGQKMTNGDFAVALRWLERIRVGRDPQRLTFEDDDSKKRQLASERGLLCQGARSECKRDHEEGRLEVGARRRLSGPFGPWCSEPSDTPAHHHHVGRERRGRAPSSCSEAFRRRGAVALLKRNFGGFSSSRFRYRC